MTYWPAWKSMPSPSSASRTPLTSWVRSSSPTTSPSKSRDRDAAGVGILLDVGLDRDVRLQRRRAGEDEAVVALEIHQGEGRGLAVIDLAVDDLRLARAAQAVAAGVRQIDPRPQAGVEDRLAFGDVDRVAERLDGELMRHVASRPPAFSSPSPCSR